MKFIALALAAAATFATSAATAGERMSDVQYLKAARCKGLAASLTGVVDNKALNAVVREAGRQRTIYVMERADNEYAQALRDARVDARKEKLTAELTGSCQAFLGGASHVAKQ
jgi:hypothetical protein